jgi:hypothetical protein
VSLHQAQPRLRWHWSQSLPIAQYELHECDTRQPLEPTGSHVSLFEHQLQPVVARQAEQMPRPPQVGHECASMHDEVLMSTHDEVCVHQPQPSMLVQLLQSLPLS